MAVGKRQFTNFHGLHPQNTKSITQTFKEQGINDQIPSYLNVACVPFLQQYFSKPGEKKVAKKGALEAHEDQLLKADLFRRVALFHSLQR